jgi:hypothetical protein
MAPNTITTTSGVTYTLKELWDKACEHDSITVASKFIVFSKDNPWMAQYNRLMALRYMQGKLGKGKP